MLVLSITAGFICGCRQLVLRWEYHEMIRWHTIMSMIELKNSGYHHCMVNFIQKNFIR